MITKILTIMFTDIKGFTERTSSSSRENLQELLNKHQELLMPVIEKFRGTLIKTIGDALMVSFESPTNAVHCGMMMQEVLRNHNENKNEIEKISIRIAISSGEVELKDNDIFGEAVNIAARIEGITDADEIYFTEAVYLSMNKSEVPSSEVGAFRLKGIPEEIKVFRVIQDPNSDSYRELITTLADRNFNMNSIPVTNESTFKSENKNNFSWKKILIIVSLALLIFGIFQLRESSSKILDEIKTAIKQDNISLAIKKSEYMLKEYPASENTIFAWEACFEAKVFELVKENKFYAADKLIRNFPKKKKWLKPDKFMKKYLIEALKFWLEKGNEYNALSCFEELMKISPEDNSIKELFLKKRGAGSKNGTTRRAVKLAMDMVSRGDHKITPLISETLLSGLKHWDYYSEEAVKLREILKTKYPEAIKFAEDNYDTSELKLKYNLFFLLKESEKINETREFKFFFDRLITESDVKIIKKSIAYFSNIIGSEKFNELKKKNNISSIEDINILRWNSETADTVRNIAGDEFLKETKPMFEKWITDENMLRRIHAFKFLQKFSPDTDINFLKYHRSNLRNFDTAFTPDSFVKAIDFFSQFNDKNKETFHRELLRSKKRISNSLERFRKKRYSRDIHNCKNNLKIIREALKKFK